MVSTGEDFIRRMCLQRAGGRLGASGRPLRHVASKRSLCVLRPASSETDHTCPDWFYSLVFDDCLYAWWFPPYHSQSRLGGRMKPSSACTLIAISIARQIYAHAVNFPDLGTTTPDGKKNNVALLLPSDALLLMTNGIIEGNTIHHREMAKRMKANDTELRDMFTIPQGIEAVGGQMHEIDFRAVRGEAWTQLDHNIRTAALHPAVSDLPVLCFILIMMERAILISLDRRRNVFVVCDSHTHQMGRVGAIVVAAPADCLDKLCTHICSELYPELLKKPHQEMVFELSCLHYYGEKAPEQDRITAKIFPRPKRSDRQISGNDEPRHACGAPAEDY